MALTISATDTELPKPLNAVFNQTLLRNAQVRAPYFAGTAPASLSKQRGSNVAMWRRIENLSAATTALTELTGAASYMQGRDAAALSVTNVTATMSKYGNFVILNEEVDLFNFPGQFDKILQVIGINAGQSLNRLQRDIGEDNATLIYANGTSDGLVNTKLVLNDIKNVINTIDKNSALTFTPDPSPAITAWIASRALSSSALFRVNEMSVTPETCVVETFCTIMSITIFASASDPKIFAAMPGVSFTPPMVTFA